MGKSPEAFRTISEVADWLGTPAHVLRFWESRFSQIKPVKRAGGRRYYRPSDMRLLGGIKRLLHDDGVTIRGVQKILREKGVKHVAALAPDVALPEAAEETARRKPAEPAEARKPAAEPAEDARPVSLAPAPQEAANSTAEPAAAEPPAEADIAEPGAAGRGAARARRGGARARRHALCPAQGAARPDGRRIRRRMTAPFLRPAALSCLHAPVKPLYTSAVGPWRSLVSASVWGTEGREFESRRPDQFKAENRGLPG